MAACKLLDGCCPPLVEMSRLKDGDLAIISDPGYYPHYNGKIVHNVGGKNVVLGEPNTYWSGGCSLKCRVLKAGETIVIG